MIQINIIYQEDCLEGMKKIEGDSLHSVVTDPPYGIGMMNNDWDKTVPSVEYWKEMYRILRPGGFLLAFSGTRTYHLMGYAIHQAGFEIHDQIHWIYGQGRPSGYGRLKPAHEPICVARKPLSEINIAANMERWDTGSLFVDTSRIPLDGQDDLEKTTKPMGRGLRTANDGYGMNRHTPDNSMMLKKEGRWPSNLIIDDSISDLLGTVGKYFYCPKASKVEKNLGLGNFKKTAAGSYQFRRNGSLDGKITLAENRHSTVKPLGLMKYLVNLVTHPFGIVLDPFMGTGTTGIAALMTGKGYIGFEFDQDSHAIAEARLKYFHDSLVENTL